MSNSIQDPSKKTSWQMFDRIASTYDPVNRILSFGLDKRWRRKVGQMIPQKDGVALLDLATGTGDQVMTLCSRHDNITKAVGMDLSEKMLDVGRQKIQKTPLKDRIEMKTGDAVQLPLTNDSFDVVTMSFGIRNVPDVPAALREMHRVLRTGGKTLILEFSMPRNPILRWGHLFYLRYVLPLVGGLISRDFKAYRYLNTSIEAFPYGENFANLVKEAGFSQVNVHPVGFGIAMIYEGIH